MFIWYLNIDSYFSYDVFRTMPKISKEDFELIFDELDDTRDFKVPFWSQGSFFSPALSVLLVDI